MQVSKCVTQLYEGVSRNRQTLGDACPSQTTVYKWAGLFKRGRRSVDNDPPPRSHPVSDVLTVLPKECFSTGIEKLEKRWLKCIRVGGDYVEK